MTRDEALRRLEGTWSYEVVGERVLLRDPTLLDAVEAFRRERSEALDGDVPAAPSPALQDAVSSRD